MINEDFSLIVTFMEWENSTPSVRALLRMMNKKYVINKNAAVKLVENIRRKMARKYSAEAKNRIVMAGLRSEESIAALCSREKSQKACNVNNQKDSLRQATDSFLAM